jgi:TIR domain-containing protein
MTQQSDTVTDQPKVFISYRRDEPGNYAGHIYRAIRDHFGPNAVFMDVVGLEPGTPWAEEIRNAVGGSRALVLVIGPGWSAALEKAGLDGQDFVELEVQIALERPDVSVIPVLFNGAAMPKGSELPGSLQQLAGREALELHDDAVRWDHGINTLRRALEKRGLRKEAEPPPRHPSPPPPPPSRDSRELGMLVLQGVLVAFAAGLLANGLVDELMPALGSLATEGADIALAAARRGTSWAIVGGALAIWLTLAYGKGRHAPTHALVGLVLGGLAGAIGATIQRLPDITDQAVTGDWVDPAAFGATGALVGALLGGSWSPPHTMSGLLAGGAGGVLVQLALGPAANPPGFALRAALIAGVVLAVIAALVLAKAATSSRPAGATLPPPYAH